MSAGLLDILEGRMADGTPVTPGNVRSRDLEARSVREHVRRLLGARQGSLVHMPGYGVPDLPTVYQDLAYAAPALAKHVQHLILTYEPRVIEARVDVSQAPPEEDFVIQLSVRALMRGNRPLDFQLGLNGQGEVLGLDDE